MTTQQVNPNVSTDPNFTQVVVWPSTTLGAFTAEQFIKWLSDEFEGARFKYLEEVTTNPDRDEYGRAVPGTGGRIDQLFYIHNEDMGPFVVKRLMYHMRWLEDVCAPQNGGTHLYPAHVYEYRSWSTPEPTGSEVVEEGEDDV